MVLIVYIVTNIVRCLIVALEFAMFLRALLSWFMPGNDNAVTEFLYTVTEPVIMPVRTVLERFEAIRNLPIDISFFATYLLLILVQYLLPSVRM